MAARRKCAVGQQFGSEFSRVYVLDCVECTIRLRATLYLNKCVNCLYAEPQLYADSGDGSKRLPQFMLRGFVIYSSVLVAYFQFHVLLGVTEFKATLIP
jgi:hypothetical protein